TDGLGRKVDFKNTVIIMTSNLGARLIDKGASLGFQRGNEKDVIQRMKDDITGELKKTFNPEFLNRIDDMVIFHPLEKKHLLEIVEIRVEELSKRVAEQGIQIEVAPEVKEWLIKEGFQPTYGARPMRRAIQKNIEDPLSEEIIKGRFKDLKKIKVVLKDNTPSFVEEEEMAGV
ncbi:MAG: AAA family ATPase, partial [Nitrospirota bacterium]